MQIQIFSVKATEPDDELKKINAFIRGHKIIDIEKQFVNIGQDSFWSILIRYISSVNGEIKGKEQIQAKIDYKELLDEKTFLIFSKLREIRKEIAISDAVPAYAVFTDYELAEIAKLPEITESSIQKVQGIGQKKAEKYGKKIQEMMKYIVV